MNRDQELAADNLQRALDRCADVDLRGGVYEASFYVWPVGAPVEAADNLFFEAADEYGECLHSRMKLDGGAGS